MPEPIPESLVEFRYTSSSGTCKGYVPWHGFTYRGENEGIFLDNNREYIDFELGSRHDDARKIRALGWPHSCIYHLEARIRIEKRDWDDDNLDETTRAK